MDSWAGRRTLVTGGGGFIGGHLAVALAQRGANVRAFCRYNSRGDRGTLDWFSPSDTAAVEVRFGDLRDAESVQQAMAGIEVVFHLGAQIAIPYSFLNPRDFFATNLGGALNVAQAALRAGIERIVHVSTSEIYGDAVTLPIATSQPPAPRSPYAASKVAADALMTSFCHSYALPVTIARPFNAYGPHQSARAIVPAIAIQAIRDGHVRLGLLEPRRDLTFVRDVVSGMIAIASSGAPPGSTLQLGNGFDVSVAELVQLIGEIVGKKLEVEVDPERVRPSDSEIARLVCDPAPTTALTGWRASTDLRTGLSETIAWLRSNLNRYRTDEYSI